MIALNERMRHLVVLVTALVTIAGCGTSSTAGAIASPSPSPAGNPSQSPSPAPTYTDLWPRSTSLAYDSTRKDVVLFGGSYNRSAMKDDTWTWDGQVWTQQHPAHSPSGRRGAALVDDPEMHAVLLFGGTEGGGDAGDTWAWNGTDWITQAPAHSPSPRDGAAMTFDPVRHNVLLFGGTGLNDTWIWNGQDWAEVHPAQSPPARGYARLAVDTAQGDAVLFGGLNQLQDTWTWDGVTWSEQHPHTVPPVLHEPNAATEQMVYDSARKVIVLAGPDDSGATETFTWDGADWTRLNPLDSPPAREGAGMAYNEADSITVWAGGYPSGSVTDAGATFGWNGTDWSVLG